MPAYNYTAFDAHGKKLSGHVSALSERDARRLIKELNLVPLEIVESISSRVTNEMFAATGIHRLVPVKDSIQRFEIHVQSTLDSLKDLLMNDEDMVQLLLTQRKEAKQKGYDLDLSTHDDVELLIEEYARRLNTILHETNYLLKKVESKQVSYEIQSVPSLLDILYS